MTWISAPRSVRLASRAVESSVGVTLRVGDHASKAPLAERLDGRLERVRQRPGVGLQQDPATAAAERGGAQLVVVKPGERGLGDLGAGGDPHVDAASLELARSARRRGRAALPITTSWSCLMCGVAQTV